MRMELRVDGAGPITWRRRRPACAAPAVDSQAQVAQDMGTPVALPLEDSLLLFWGPWSPHPRQKNKL